MADYYPLISRALDGLSDKSPDMRRAVYDRARAALMAQLQSLKPPLPAAEITRERLALDEAIDRVEIAYALSEASLQPPPPAAYAAGPLGRPDPRGAARSAQPPARAEPSSGPGPRAEPPPLGSRAESLSRAVTPLRPEAPVEPRPSSLPERQPEGLEEREVYPPPPRERPRVDTVARALRDQGRTRAMVLAGVLAVVVGLIAVAAWLLRVQPSEIQDQPAAVEGQAPADADSKLGDRVTGERAPGAGPGQAQPTAPGGAPRPDVAVAQRAILYEENPSDTQNPRATAGRALWRLDAVNPGQGQALETVVRASIDTSGAGFSLALSLRRNNDATLPASHIIELNFSTGDDPNRMVRDVGLLQFKGEEAVRGTPVAGLPVPVKDNVFLIGLSNLPGDMERNRDLMLRRNWIDLPVRFASGQRAILSFEKGVSGDQVLNEAFRQWGQ